MVDGIFDRVGFDEWKISPLPFPVKCDQSVLRRAGEICRAKEKHQSGRVERDTEVALRGLEELR